MWQVASVDIQGNSVYTDIPEKSDDPDDAINFVFKTEHDAFAWLSDSVQDGTVTKELAKQLVLCICAKIPVFIMNERIIDAIPVDE